MQLINVKFFIWKLKNLTKKIFLATKKAVGSVALNNVTLSKNPEQKLSIIGLFYVLPEYRNQKIGKWLFDRMLEDCVADKFLYGGIKL